MKYVTYNPNPAKKNVGDCTVRAISKALNMEWEEAYTALCLEGYIRYDMPSSNSVWGAYLHRRGFSRYLAPEDCTVAQFAKGHPRGTYILALSGHVVCLQNGIVYDSWDSSGEVPLYFWYKE